MRITCPSCKQSDEGLTLVRTIFVTIDITNDGEQVGGADYANDGRTQWLNCPCGHSWRTSRYIEASVDVR